MSTPDYRLQIDVERLRFAGKLGLYVRTVSTSWPRFCLEQLVFLLASWVPTAVGVALRALVYPLVVRGRWPLIVEKNVTLHRPGAIRLGRNVFLAENVYLLAGGQGISMGDFCEVLPGAVLMIRDYRGVPDAGITIGRHCGINTGAVIFSHGRTTIGDDVQIGPGAVITTGGHRFEDPSRPVRVQGAEIRDVEIGAGAWIGAHAVILPGVRVGPGAVVAAGAVVTEDVPAHSLVAGVPARLIRDWKPEGAAGGS